MSDTAKYELLEKLKRLAEQGEGGEKINAKTMLDRYMEKYGITDIDLGILKKDTCEFKYNGKTEEILLVQILYKVTNATSTYRYRRNNKLLKNILGCDCTQAQRIEIEFLFDFYKELYRKESEFFFNAFIQKHRLFGKLADGEKPNEMDEEEILKIMRMQSGMSDETPLLRINGGN